MIINDQKTSINSITLIILSLKKYKTFIVYGKAQAPTCLLRSSVIEPCVEGHRFDFCTENSEYYSV